MKNFPQAEENDEVLLRRAKTGDEESFVALYRRHQGPLFRFALYLSGSQHVAEEIVQDVFMSLLSNGGSYAPAKGALEGYLIGMVRNLVRARQRDSRRFTSEVRSREEAEANGPFAVLSKQQELAELRAAILSLPLNYREVVALCDLENMDYLRAAEKLGCPVGTVRSRLHRARAILRAKLQKAEKWMIC